MFIEEMSKSMIDNRMKTRITENYFPDAASSRITIENYCDFFSQDLKHIYPPIRLSMFVLFLTSTLLLLISSLDRFTFYSWSIKI